MAVINKKKSESEWMHSCIIIRVKEYKRFDLKNNLGSWCGRTVRFKNT